MSQRKHILAFTLSQAGGWELFKINQERKWRKNPGTESTSGVKSAPRPVTATGRDLQHTKVCSRPIEMVVLGTVCHLQALLESNVNVKVDHC